MKKEELKLINGMLQSVKSTMKEDTNITDTLEMDIGIYSGDIPDKVNAMIDDLIETIESNDTIELDNSMDIVFRLLQEKIKNNWPAKDSAAEKITNELKTEYKNYKISMSLRELRALALSDSIKSYIEFDEYVINWCNDNTIGLYLDDVQYFNILIRNK